jgi:hypothetical protein
VALGPEKGASAPRRAGGLGDLRIGITGSLFLLLGEPEWVRTAHSGRGEGADEPDK